MEAFRQRLFHHALLVCRQYEDAEEITQETLLRVFQNLDQLREPERVRAWVFRIARNACLMRRRGVRPAPEQELSLDELKPAWQGEGDGRRLDLADWRALPDDEVLRGELRRALEEAIAGLPEMYKTVLLLRDREELSTEETAGILEITPDAVKARLHRARLAVRRALDEALQGRQHERVRRLPDDVRGVVRVSGCGARRRGTGGVLPAPGRLSGV